jgi:alcohol dehydrogenase
LTEALDNAGTEPKRQHVLFGEGALTRMTPFAARAGARVLLVSDAGVRAAGHARTCANQLEGAGLELLLLSDVPENPSRGDARRLAESAREFQPHTVVAVGGGSVIDCAKGAVVELTQEGGLGDLHGRVTFHRPTLPLIAVPTTAGTGSECQSAALLSDEETGVKRALLAPGLLPAVAVLEPSLTRSQPAHVATATAIDAVAHGVEAAVSRSRTERSTRYALAALELLLPNIERALDDPDDEAARAAVQLGAAVAGMAIEQSMLGAAHAAANPLTARCELAHGLAVGFMLPEVVRFNAEDPECRAVYGTMARRSGLVAEAADEEDACASLVAFLDRLSRRATDVAGCVRLTACAWEERAELAQDATLQWTGGFNPRAAEASDFITLYDGVFARLGQGASS